MRLVGTLWLIAADDDVIEKSGNKYPDAPCKLTEQRRHLSASLYRFKSLTRALDRLVETINLIRERGLDPSANCNLAKGMLPLFGNPI